MRVVILTNGSTHALGILAGCRTRGIPIAAVALEWARGPWDCLPKANEGSWPIRCLKAIVRYQRRRKHQRMWLRTLAAASESVVTVAPLGSRQLIRQLKALDVDVLALGGIGLLNRDELACARTLVVNSHPGLLPWARGVDVVGHSILRRIPNGATLHAVDAGIDRGAVISRRLTPLRAVERDLQRIAEATDRLAIDMMVDGLEALVTQGAHMPLWRQDIKFPLCRTMSPDERTHVDRLARDGQAHALWQAWRDQHGIGDDGELPAHLPTSAAGQI